MHAASPLDKQMERMKAALREHRTQELGDESRPSGTGGVLESSDARGARGVAGKAGGRAGEQASREKARSFIGTEDQFQAALSRLGARYKQVPRGITSAGIAMHKDGSFLINLPQFEATLNHADIRDRQSAENDFKLEELIHRAHNVVSPRNAKECIDTWHALQQVSKRMAQLADCV